MKNIKNTVAAIGLVAVLGLGATAANAGVIVHDAPVPQTTGCSVKGGFIQTVIQGINGFLLSDGMLISDGLMVSDGMLISDASTRSCGTTKEGILVSDGMLISD